MTHVIIFRDENRFIRFRLVEPETTLFIMEEVDSAEVEIQILIWQDTTEDIPAGKTSSILHSSSHV